MLIKFILVMIPTMLTAWACQFVHPQDYKGELKPNIMYSHKGPFVARKDGHIMLYVANSKNLKGKAFRERLKKHVELVSATMKPLGEVGYLVYANNDQELALIQWPSEEAMKKAYDQKGSVIMADSSLFMDRKIWEKFDPTHYPVSEGWLKHQLKRAKEGAKAP